MRTTAIPKWFKLTKDYEGFKKGAIMLLGDENTGEYFDITTEMTTGESYSTYTMDTDFLTPFKKNECIVLSKMLSDFINENYPSDPNHKILTF